MVLWMNELLMFIWWIGLIVAIYLLIAQYIDYLKSDAGREWVKLRYENQKFRKKLEEIRKCD